MKNFKSIILLLGVAAALVLIADALSPKDIVVRQNVFTAGPVLADEIYPMFFCPCCGQPLDKKNICCPMAQERIDYIDFLTVQNFSEKEIILAYAKKYGLNSFVDKEKQNEVKEWLVESAPADRPIISTVQDYYDFGYVSQKGGMVFTYFDIKNEGNKDLIISGLGSSCGCTSAAVVYEGVEGPRFAMAGHGIENPTDWSLTVPPGARAQLKVYYDPDIHNDFRGPATREVSIFSNDPIDFEKKVIVDLNQVD